MQKRRLDCFLAIWGVLNMQILTTLHSHGVEARLPKASSLWHISLINKPHKWISLHPITTKVFLYHKRPNRMLKTEFRWDPQKWWFKSPILAKYQKRSNSPKNLHIACFQHSEWYGNVNWLKRKRLGHRGAHHTLFTPLKDIPISITFSSIRKPSLKRIGWVFPKQSRNLTQWPPFHSSSHVVQ